MKTLISACIFSIPFLAGCSTTYYVPQISDANEFGDAQAKVHGRPATVTLVDGTEIRLDSTRMRADSVIGVEEDTRIRQELPLSQIREITIRHFGRGAGRGALNGLMWGGALGLVVDAAARADPVLAPSGDDDFLVVATFALCGAFVGAVVGMGALSPEHYEFSEEAVATFGSQKPQQGSGTHPQYVLMVEKFLAETVSTVTIPWQGKTVTLRKSEITIEKHVNGYRITAPARLLQ